MEIIINSTTFTLKSVNAKRRAFFIQNVLSFYNYQASNFEEYLLSSQKYLKENHKKDYSIEQLRNNFFKLYSENLHICIWSFLSAENKQTLKTIDNLDISVNELKKFIEHVSLKIKEYSIYVNSNKSEGVPEDLHTIYSYISRVYGWTFAEIEEMDELDLLKALENAINMLEKENVNNINSQALAGAYVGGSKKAKSQIDSINKKITRNNNIKIMEKSGNIPQDNISRDTIEAIMRSKNG